jgi:hypothetical protein
MFASREINGTQALASYCESALSDNLDVKKFQEEGHYVCRSCSRELEKMERLEAQLNEVKRNMLSKVTNAACFFTYG